VSTRKKYSAPVLAFALTGVLAATAWALRVWFL